ncbi:DUF5602 domain-containing protein [Dankookia sp. P2]|uniref:DUF5602 domain-containing protein n=1 Tax=Dankookia sp. P2 TaxID=3423955 RepID=UPI003D674D14
MHHFGKVLAATAFTLLPALHAGPARAQPVASAQAARTVEGARLPLGRGTATAWVGLDARGAPVAVGVDLTEAALDDLPGHKTGIDLALPPEAGQAGYDHVGLDWEAHGHAPAGVYDVPHFDVHFYRIGVAERDRIVREDPAFEARLARPPAEGIPPPGLRRGAGTPRMGQHWGIADAVPDQPGRPFEKVMVIGSYDGRLIFLEPMMTRAFLLTRPDVTIPIRAPARAEGRLWWPDAYRVSFRDGVYRIALTGLRPLPG